VTPRFRFVLMFQRISGHPVPRGLRNFSSPRLSLISNLHRSSMRALTVDALNPAILDVQYAVRGELAIKAEEYRVRLKAGAKDLPFDKVTSTNIGNPQQAGLDQPPITFNRQVSKGVHFGISMRWLFRALRRCSESNFDPFFFFFFFAHAQPFVGGSCCCVVICAGGGVDGMAGTR
jgi:hypothetical protein